MYMVKRLDLWVNIEENTDEKTQFGKCLFCLTLYCNVLCTVLFRHYYSSGGFPPLPDTVLLLTALQYSWLALQSNYFPDNSISTQTKRYYQFKAFNKINLELVNTF